MQIEQKDKQNPLQLSDVISKIPVGITVTDLDGRIRYYNEYCARIVDRKPEYIGQDIRTCHQKPASAAKIDQIFEEIKSGRREEYYYESVRNGKHLAVTVSPYTADDKPAGFIQTITLKR